MLLRPATLAALLVVLGSAGCAPNDSRSRHLRSDGSWEEGPAWPYWARSMRVHPLSQIAPDRDSGDPVIEARIEFLDPLDHTCKGVGQLQLELAAAGRSAGPIAQWQMDLRDPAVNRRHYDDVTRTYLFRLKIDPDKIPDEPALLAEFLSADGRHMEADYRLPR